MQGKTLFGTSGIRGSVEELFTPQFCFDLGRTFVEFLKAKNLLGSLAVGMDPRASSPNIKKDLFKGLATSKVELFDEGVTPIPSMNWLIKNTGVKAAVMITGSHIAANLNGVKFYAHDEEISEGDEREIEKIYWKIKGNTKVPKEEPQVNLESRAAELYRDMLSGLIKKDLPHWKIGVDTANGAQTVVIPELLESFSLKVFRVNCDIQQPFIARDTDADNKAELEKLKELVKKERCDFGIAYDGDGDRVVFIDEKGNLVLGEYSCCLVARQTKSDVIVTTISASQVAEKIGKKVVRTKVGSPYVVGKMKEVGSSFGFEPNGGAVSAEIQYTRDGGSMTMKILNLFSDFKGTFSEMVATLPKFYMSRTKIDYPWELQSKILGEAKKNFKGIRIEEIDGLKIWLDDTTWILFRSSQNAPEFRVFAESKSKEKSEKMLREGIDFVKKVIRENA